MKTPEQLKDAVRNIAVKNNLRSKEVLQMYLFERILARLAISPYRNNFVLKGGLLISSLIGIESRTTMDMDTTVCGIELNADEITRITKEIFALEADDGIQFTFCKITPIREENPQHNFRVHLVASYGKINVPMKIDITTGDVITPSAVQYDFPLSFENTSIPIVAYPIETILAEKYEAIIHRNISTTQTRDFYDLHILYKMKQDQIRLPVLKLAIDRTAQKRGSAQDLKDWKEIIRDIREEPALEKLWKNYVAENTFARGLTFSQVVDTLEEVANTINSMES